MHPLIGDLSTLRDSEIEGKINQLTAHYFNTHNEHVRNQLVMALDSYRTELVTRRTSELEKSLAGKNKDIDKLININ